MHINLPFHPPPHERKTFSWCLGERLRGWLQQTQAFWVGLPPLPHPVSRARLRVASPIIWLSHVTWHRWSDLPPHVDGRYVAVASSRSTDRSIGQTLAFRADNEKSQSAVWHLPVITFFFFILKAGVEERPVRGQNKSHEIIWSGREIL